MVSLDEREYKKIRVGMKALVSEQASPEKDVLTASILKVSPGIDTAQGTVEVTLALEKDMDIKPGAAVNVEIIVREEKGVTVFPRRYLSLSSGQPVVWTEKEGKAYPLLLSNLEYLNDWVKTTDLPPGTVLLDPKSLQKGKRVVPGKRRND